MPKLQGSISIDCGWHLRCLLYGTKELPTTAEKLQVKRPKGGCTADRGHLCFIVSSRCTITQCRKVRTYVSLSCGHQCPRKCFELRSACIAGVKRLLRCGYLTDKECHVSLEENLCMLPRMKPLECGHDCCNPYWNAVPGSIVKAYWWHKRVDMKHVDIL